MHRHPPRHGARRSISTRSRRRSRRRLAATQGRRPARQGQPHGRAGLPRPARRRPRPDRQAGRRRRAHRLGQSRSVGRPRRRRLHGADPAARRRSVERRRGPRRRGVRPGVDDHALPRPRRRHRARQSRHGQPRVVAVHPFARRPRATSSRAPPPITAGCWSSTATMPPKSTGHGSPLPVLVHGGPGRAGGSEEMGGVRGVKHYMQRTAIQSSPAMIAAITEQYIPGAPKHVLDAHPFRKRDERASHRRHAAGPPAAPSRSPTSSISPTSPATISTPTWTRKRPRPRRSSKAASPTAISS